MEALIDKGWAGLFDLGLAGIMIGLACYTIRKLFLRLVDVYEARILEQKERIEDLKGESK